MRIRTLRALGSMTSLLLVGAAYAGTVVHVDDDAPPGGDGASWSTAYRFLQDALAEADRQTEPVEIRVAGGLYLPDRDETTPLGSRDRWATIKLLDDVAIRGGYLGLDAGRGDDPDTRDIELYVTIASGDLAGDDDAEPVQNAENSYHVVTAHGVGPTAVLDGLTVMAGNADAPVFGHLFGGGLWASNASPTLIDCRFEGSVATEGGGMHNDHGSSPVMFRCTFSGNRAFNRGGAMRNLNGSNPFIVQCVFSDNHAQNGGAIRSEYSNPTILRTTFEANSATDLGGALAGGPSSDAIITHCTFSGNTAGDDGGAIHSADGSVPTITKCVFTSNEAPRGGAVALDDSKAAIDTCVFEANTAEGGGGLYNFESDPSIKKSTFKSNAAMNGFGRGGGVYNDSSSPFLVGCVFVENRAIRGAAVGNVLSAPEIVDTSFVLNSAVVEGGGLYVHASSQPLVSGCSFVGNAAGLSGGGSFSSILGQPEFSDSIFCSNTPDNVDGTWIDGGGNEMSLVCPETCPADLNADGLVSGADMLVVVSQWGCVTSCLADIDGNDAVGVGDLLAILMAWGTCP